MRKQRNHVAKRKIYKNIIQTSIRTYERIAITYHGVRFPDHLVRHPEVEIESRLILAEPEQLEGDGDSLGLAVVNRGPPRRTAPEAAHVRSLGLRNLERTVRTPLSSERHKFPQGETVERQLKSQEVSTWIEIVGWSLSKFIEIAFPFFSPSSLKKCGGIRRKWNLNSLESNYYLVALCFFMVW